MIKLDYFDPLKELPAAQSARPAELFPLNMRVLTPYQRALLVIDGTVTKFIEAFALEPMEIIRIGQDIERVPESDPWLQVEKDTEVALRTVFMRGTYSRLLYTYATSRVVMDRLPEEAGRRLLVQGEGIGRIMNDLKLETRREILWFGRERFTDLPPQVKRISDGEFISRTYRILFQGLPVALINEKFPSGVDSPAAQ